MMKQSSHSLQARLLMLLGLVPFLASPVTQACAMHGMNFSAFGGGDHLSKPKPPMVALELNSVVRTAAGARGVLEIGIAEASGIVAERIQVTIIPESSVTLEGPASLSITHLPERFAVGFTAEEGYHMVDVVVSGTVDGKAREFTRQIYVIAQDGKVARR